MVGKIIPIIKDPVCIATGLYKPDLKTLQQH
jgi:hypothetical protein